MTRRLLATTIAVLLGLAVIPAQGPQNATAAINWNLIMFPTNRSAPMDQQRKDPVKLFDNLYSVGVQTVCAFLIPTSAGLVLVDTTYPETADLLLENIRKAGFDPATIRYIFSHMPRPITSARPAGSSWSHPAHAWACRSRTGKKPSS